MAATPTPSKALPLPSSTSSHHHVMTPSSINHHLSALSPLPSAPRSVGQSPANASRKSPAHAVMVQQLQSQSQSQSQSQQQQHQPNRGRSDSGGPLAYDTPTAAALGLNLNLPGLDAAVAARVAAVNLRTDDDERKRRIEAILALLRHRPGRVSEEGLERLAKRCELECLWEDGPAGLRTLTMAGSGILLEVRTIIMIIIIAIIPMGSSCYRHDDGDGKTRSIFDVISSLVSRCPFRHRTIRFPPWLQEPPRSWSESSFSNRDHR